LERLQGQALDRCDLPWQAGRLYLLRQVSGHSPGQLFPGGAVDAAV